MVHRRMCALRFEKLLDSYYVHGYYVQVIMLIPTHCNMKCVGELFIWFQLWNNGRSGGLTDARPVQSMACT